MGVNYVFIVPRTTTVAELKTKIYEQYPNLKVEDQIIKHGLNTILKDEDIIDDVVMGDKQLIVDEK